MMFRVTYTNGTTGKIDAERYSANQDDNFVTFYNDMSRYERFKTRNDKVRTLLEEEIGTFEYLYRYFQDLKTIALVKKEAVLSIEEIK